MKKTTGKTNAKETQNVKNAQNAHGTKGCGKGCGKNAKDCG